VAIGADYKCLDSILLNPSFETIERHRSRSRVEIRVLGLIIN